MRAGLLGLVEFSTDGLRIDLLFWFKGVGPVDTLKSAMRSPVVHNIRKPWGEGRAAMQKLKRQVRSQQIASQLLERLDTDSIQLTGQLFPRGNLKKRSVRCLFSWVHQFPGRVFTTPLLNMVIRKLLRSIGDVPRNPKQSYGGYVSSQAKRLGILARRSKRIKEGSGGFGVSEFNCFFESFLHT